MKYLINVDVDVFMRENRTYEIEANSEEEAKEILKRQALEKLNPTPVVNNSTNNQYQQNIGTIQNINIHTSSLNIPTNQNGGLVIPTLDNQNNQFIDTTNNPQIEQKDAQQIEQISEEETEENNL